GGPGVRAVGGGAVSYVLAGLERSLTVRAVGEAQVSALLLLLPGPKPGAHPRQAPEWVTVSDPDLRQRPRVAGSATPSARHQLHEARQCLRAAERHRAVSRAGRQFRAGRLDSCARPVCPTGSILCSGRGKFSTRCRITGLRPSPSTRPTSCFASALTSRS